MPGTTTDVWNGTGIWTADPTDWSLASPPTAAEDAEIQTGANTLTTTQSITSLQVDAGAVLELQTGGTLTASGTAAVAGDVYMQNGASASVSGDLGITGSGRVVLEGFLGGTGGTSLSVGGTLTNSSTDNNALDVGSTGITAGDTLTVAALVNTGEINIEGGGTVQSSMIVGSAVNFGTAGVATGVIFLENDALLQFASGQVGTIAAGSIIQLAGAGARIADAGGAGSNSALTGLTQVPGDLLLQNGASVAATGNLNITGAGRVVLEGYLGGIGGSSLSVGGTLTNNSIDNNALDVGSTGITAGDTLTVAALVNTGEINIEGGGTVQSSMIVGSAANFGTVGVATGDIFLVNDALLQFASGQVGTIAAGSIIQLAGAGARIADAGGAGSNSALTGLTQVPGYLLLQNGASVATGGNLNITGAGRVVLEGYLGGIGGTTLSVGGTLTNSSTDGNALDVGSTGITAGDTLTAAALVNTGEINIEGGGTVQSSMIVGSAANFGTVGVATGDIFLVNDALLQFASGQVGTVAAGSIIQLAGAGARIADAGGAGSNSALTGLTQVPGYLLLQNGASVATGGNLNITGAGRVVLEGYLGGIGGTTLSVGGTLTNSSTDGNALDVGSTGITAGDTLTAAALVNTGEINIEGGGTVQSSMIVGSAANFGTVGVATGDIFLVNDALLQFASGQVGTVAAGSAIQLDGTGARIADSGSAGSNSALTGLAQVPGYLLLQNGASAAAAGNLNITGAGRVVLEGYLGGIGGTTLSVGGTLTNSSTDGNALDVGSTGITTGDTLTAAALVNTGEINIEGGGSVQSSMIIGSAANFGTVGVATGDIFLVNDALLQFASGQVGTIAAGSAIQLDGTGARIADSGSAGSNSALTGLAQVPGYLLLQNGASAAAAGNLNITGAGRVVLEGYLGGIGGTTLSVGGTLTNSSTDSNALDVGSTGITSGDTLTAGALNNAGEVNLAGGNASAQGVLAINGPATNTGMMDIGAFGEVLMGTGDLYTQAAGATNISTSGVLDPAIVDVTGGSLDGTGTVIATVNNNGGGTVFGGPFIGSPGTLTIDGTYNQSGSGILEANIGAGGSSPGVVAAGSGDFVFLSGGTLQVSSAPAVGTVLTVMTFTPGDLFGQFAHVAEGSAVGDGSNVNLGDGTSLEVFYNEDNGTIQIERVNNSSLASGYTWIGGTGNWSVAADWSGGQVPNPTANVVIGQGTGGSVSLNGSSGDTTVNALSITNGNGLTISGVTLTSATGGGGIAVAAGGDLALSSNGQIQGSVLSGAGTISSGNGVLTADTIVAGTTITAANGAATTLNGPTDNAGAIDLTGGGGNNGFLDVGNQVTLTGGGTIALADLTGAGNAYIQGNNQILANVDNTILGTGIIGNGNLVLDNGGLVEATPEGGTTALTLNSSGGVSNSDLLEAKGGGVLVVNTSVANAGGTITAADASSTVELFDADVQGGRLSNSAGGTLETVSAATLDGNTGGALTIGGGSNYIAARSGANDTTTLTAAIDNAGTIVVNGGAGANGILAIGSATTLTGAGTVLLSDTTGAGSAFIQGNGQTLTNANNTIEGTGVIGNGSLSLVNDGTLDATPAGGTSTLTLNGSGGTTNNGLLEASANGVLVIASNVSNEGSNITANGGTSTVAITAGATITGGTLNTVGSGDFETNPNSSAVLQGVTISRGSAYVADTAGANTTTTLLGTIDNAGTVALGGGSGANGFLTVGNAVTLTGGGAVLLSNATGAGNALINGNGQTLTNSNNVIQGTGIIGDGSLVLVNNGTVDATPSGGTATLTLNGGGVTINQLLEATNGGALAIATNVSNTGGAITSSGTASVVSISGGVTIAGGTLNTTGAAVMRTAAAGSAVLQGVTISSGSTYTASNNATTTLLGTIDDIGAIQETGGDGLNGFLAIGDAVTLTGGGKVVLNDLSGSGFAYLQGNNQTLTNADDTIQGTGIIGDGNLVLINDGTVDATPAGNTSTLTLNSSGGVTNTALMEASGGGVLAISAPVANAGGNITVADSLSTIAVSGGTIQGGTLNNAAGGTFETENAVLDGLTLGALTISAGSTVTANNGATTTLDGTIDNNGTLSLTGAGGTNGILQLGTNVTLAGTGTVVLNTLTGSGSAYLEGNGLTLTNAGNTVEGTGVIGNGSLALTNDGTVAATPEGGTSTLTLNGSGGITNNKLLAAQGGGVLVISTTVNNGDGAITVADGSSTIELASAVVQGGTLNNSAGGTLETVSNATLDGSTAAGAVTVSAGSTFTASNNVTTTLAGTIDNAGTIQLLGGGGANGVLSLADNVTLASGGTVTLTNLTGSGNAFVEGNGFTLTNLDNTIQGTGVIGNGSLALTNEGTVDATPEGGTSTLTLNGSGGVTNDRLLEATGGASLSITAGSVNNQGTVQALDGSSVTYGSGATDENASGGTLTGGVWNAIAAGHGATLSITGGPITTDAADITLSGSGSAMQAYNGSTYVDIQTSLTAVANAGQLHILAGRSYTTSNAIANAGLVDLGGGTFTARTFANSGTLSGFGSVTSTLGSALTNLGSVVAEGGDLVLAQGVTGATGAVTIASNGSLDISGASGGNTVDTLLHDGANLNLGSENITVSSDYNNANFGVGNAFKAHANVTGSGLILAAGNTGLSVTDGSLMNAGTLALGNVHVSGTIDSRITITNTGTAGPVLRGAVQNTGLTNGAITLAAENYGPLALGASTTEAISFNPNAAGALTGQDFDVVTNFDNIAAQTIAVTGTAYNLASSNTIAPINTIVHVGDGTGDALTQALIIANTAPAAFSEGLDAAFGAYTPTIGATPTLVGSPITDLAAGSASTAMGLAFNTGSAGTVSGSVVVHEDSNGTIDGLGNTGLPDQTVAITTVIDNYASFGLANATAGTLTGSGSSFTLNLGTIAQGSGSITAALDALNDAVGPADALSATANSFVVGSGSGNFSINEAAFSDLLAGGAHQAGDVTIALDPLNLGMVTETIQLIGSGSNASGYSSGANVIDPTVTIEAMVTATSAGLSIVAPGTAVVGVGQASTIATVSLADPGAVGGETFTLTLSDTNGGLSLTQSGSAAITNNGGTNVTVSGSFTDVNNTLKTLSDTDAAAGGDTIRLNGTDSLGDVATQQTIAVTVNGTPTITVPGAQTIGVGQAGTIAGVSVTETGAPETVAVTLADTNGLLSLTQSGSDSITNNGGTNVTVSGSFTDVDNTLKTLSDEDATAGGDTIRLNGTDSLGDVATQQTIAVTVNGTPTITVPGAQTIGVGQPGTIAGVSVTETGNPGTVAVTLADTNGLLSLTQSGSDSITNNGGTNVTVSGSVTDVDNTLKTLSDKDATVGGDTIKVNATDNFGNVATQQTIAVTVNAAPTITVPGAQTIGVGQAGTIAGVSVTETGNPGTVAVTLADTNGLLTLTQSGSDSITNNGGTNVTVSGSFTDVDNTLKTLSDEDATAGGDTIKVNATDNFGNVATQQTIAVTVNAAPTITVPGAQTIGVGQAGTIAGVSVTETGNPGTVAVTLADTNGLLSLTQSGSDSITNNGGTNVTVSGSVTDMDNTLKTLSDKDATVGGDTIKVNATDNFGNVAAQQTIAVTVNGGPTITVPGAQTLTVGQAGTIAGVSVTETGNPGTVAVTLSDTNGLLSLTQSGSDSITNNGGADVTVSGSFTDVDNTLKTLSDKDATAGGDTIKVNATDNFGNVATQQTIAVTVNAAPTITVPGAQTIGVGQPGTIAGVSVTETGNPGTVAVTLADTNGLLSLTQSGSDSITNNGGTNVTVSGSFTDLDNTLKTLSDKDATAGGDTIKVNATDNFGNVAAQQTIAVTVNAAPTITVPGAQTLTVGQAGTVAGVSVTETGNPETVVVTLSDTNGLLSLTQSGSDSITNNGGTDVTVSGSFTDVDNTLKTLSDKDATAGGDTIKLNATDNFGNIATKQTIAVTATTQTSGPAISGTKPGQTTVDFVPILPFSSVSVTSTATGAQDSLTITIENSSSQPTDANGTLSGTGLTKIGVGRYSLAATSPGLLTKELDALTFTPTEHEVPAGKTVTTDFVLTASQTAGGVTTSTTNSNTSVVVTALNYINGPANGYGILIGTPGQDVMTAHGRFNFINSEGGADFINAGAGYAFVILGPGNATVTLGGTGNTVLGDGGNVTVTGGSGGDNYIQLGNGNNVVDVGGYDDTIILGNRNNTVQGPQGMAFISTGSGNDTIVFGGSGNTVNAGGGTNSISGGTGDNTFVLPPAGQGFDTIAGFTETNGDILNLQAALAATGWNGRSATLGNYLKVTSAGGNTTLAIAPTGSGSGIAIASLQGSGNFALSDLLSHHSLLT